MDRPAPISVIVARFEDLVSRGLCSLIAGDSELRLVAAEVPHERIDRAISDHAPQVALINYAALRSPIEVHELTRGHPHTAVMVLAGRPSAAECNQMLAFGAIACLSKETEARDILSAVHLASRGLQVLPRAPAGVGTPELPGAGPDLLTAREADVLAHLQQGRSNAEIAAALQVGVETVRTHARHIYRKLGVRTRRELGTLRVATPPGA